MMKIVITGAKGMLGHDLARVLDGHDLFLFDSKSLDITDMDVGKEKVLSVKPDILINAAAFTDVDACESQFDDAYKVNASGVRNLALVCSELDIPLVHISTDYVFKGDKNTPLVEDDPVGPNTAYGKTKLKGEEFIQEVLDKYFIIRTAWLYGHDGANFVETMLSLSETNDELNVVNDQVGSPTFTSDLAVKIGELIDSDKYGIYHVTNSGSCSWQDFAVLIFKLSNISIKVNPVLTVEFPRPAPRPKYSVLSNQKLIDNGFKPLRSYSEALEEYLKER